MSSSFLASDFNNWITRINAIRTQSGMGLSALNLSVSSGQLASASTLSSLKTQILNMKTNTYMSYADYSAISSLSISTSGAKLQTQKTAFENTVASIERICSKMTTTGNSTYDYYTSSKDSCGTNSTRTESTTSCSTDKTTSNSTWNTQSANPNTIDSTWNNRKATGSNTVYTYTDKTSTNSYEGTQSTCGTSSCSTNKTNSTKSTYSNSTCATYSNNDTYTDDTNSTCKTTSNSTYSVLN